MVEEFPWSDRFPGTQENALTRLSGTGRNRASIRAKRQYWRERRTVESYCAGAEAEDERRKRKRGKAFVKTKLFNSSHSHSYCMMIARG